MTAAAVMGLATAATLWLVRVESVRAESAVTEVSASPVPAAEGATKHGGAADSVKPSDRVDFNRDIRPILAETCFACHGFDEKSRKAKLRLDVPETAYADHDGTTPIKPGNLAESEAWRRISTDDEDDVMPPVKFPQKLTAPQKLLIKRWIEQGAHYEKHWSLIPPTKAPPPEVSKIDWPVNEIDRFVLARLDAEGLKPSAEADRRMYIRRVSLDLTGLPPSADEVEAFVADTAPDAYEKLVDRLLASPHFGERMALDWLDAARYADSNGFSIDGGRQMWLWRDWVINAFNTNKPYDQFLVEQLAGDLLPNATPSQLIATGFERNNMVTHEGGTIPEENLVNYNVDRVKTLGEAVLGLTLGCAQCHDHKYDPIPQRDFYKMFAFFNSASDIGLDGNGGVNPRPYISAKTVLRTGEEPAVQAQIAELEAKLLHPHPGLLQQWENRQRQALADRGRDLQVFPVSTLKVSTPNRGQGYEIRDGHVRINEVIDMAAYDVAVGLPQTSRPVTGFRVVFHPSGELGGWGHGPVERRAAAAKKAAGRAKSAPAADEETPADPEGQAAATRSEAAKKDAAPEAGEKPQAQPATAAKGKAAAGKAAAGKAAAGKAAGKMAAVPAAKPFKGNFMLTALTVSADAVVGDQVNLNRLLDVRRVTANTWQATAPPAGCLDPRNDSGWSPDLTWQGDVVLTATLASPLDVSRTPFATLQLNFGNGKSQIASDFEIFAIAGADDGTDLPGDVVAIVQKPAADRSSVETGRLAKYFADQAEETRADRVELANLQERLAVQEKSFSTMVMDTAAAPRETFILHRGDYAQPTEKVSPGTLGVLPPMPEGAPVDRLGLARWLTMREHPLTARVAVNRFWQSLFGIGIVRTSADFGTQGEWPSHIELLDWLAVDFMESGWNTKAVLRKMVLSRTYRQTSAATPELLDRDPQNRLLARGPRFRLSAEQIRDSALKVSGLLVPWLGGPSVNPYTPGDLWREISHYGSTPATAQTFVQDHGQKLYRRSLYTFWKRTAPPPNMAVFDAPNREVCTVARPQTNTPLQSLVLLNDVQYVEAARAFAERVIHHDGDDAAKLGWAFEECLSRRPEARELKVLAAALVRERARYAADENDAKSLLANGESPRDATIPAAEHAAWTQVATLLLNLSETVTRN